MAAESDYAQERERLLEFGVPAHVVEHALALRPVKGIYVASLWIAVAIMLAGFGVGALLWIVLEQMIASRVVAAARSAGASLYDFTLGFSMLFALFGWLLASSLVNSMIFLGTARGRATLFVYNLLDAKG